MWTHLVRQTAGGGKSPIGTRGPGETQLETDRRHIRQRIDKLKNELEQVRRVRAVQRRQRKKAELPLVAIVGYTNAGKSTLLNTLTARASRRTTACSTPLDPTTRKKRISDTQEILLSDTVGFIRKLPHHLVSAFKATLEELAYADLLLHVVDVSDEDWPVQAETVEKVIAQLGRTGHPAPDGLQQGDKCAPGALPYFPAGRRRRHLGQDRRGHRRAAAHDRARAGPRQASRSGCASRTATARCSYMLHREAQILSTDYAAEGTVVEAVVDEKLYGRIRDYFDGN